MRFFVPGRICLFGEHSDWAGAYRRINPNLGKGFAILTGTNQGIHADVKPHPDKLIVSASCDGGTRTATCDLPMEHEPLLAEAQGGGFFSYAAGAAYQVLTHYHVGGLEINNVLTDLPVKKGLSSSAAICVLIVRAFNRMYNLSMSVREEMELAYMGEVTTPSRCGRLDQGCAYGGRPIMMVFDGDQIEIRELDVPRDLHFVIVDLNAGKDTREILEQLNRCYPFAENEMQRNVQTYLGPINARIAHEAFKALHEGDSERVGTLMGTAQEQFDKYLQPVCPSQLTAPVLHKVLRYEPLHADVLGGKGVGSQGDGAAQFIVRDRESQCRVIEILERGLGMHCLELTIRAHRS
jgi:galactokinase